MLHTLQGKVTAKYDNSLVLDWNGMGFKVHTNARTLSLLPPEGQEAKLFCHLFVREDRIELYGFFAEEDLTMFEMLNSVGGVGPKTALGVLDIDRVPNIMAAILEKRADVLTHASGIGKKTAERIILELHNKVKLPEGHETQSMNVNHQVEDVLVGLGYSRHDVRAVLQNMKGEETIEERLRHALRELGSTK